MEKRELQRKSIATIVATLVLCALLGVSVWLLLTTDVFTPLIKGLMVACCVLLAAAIIGFLHNKLVEIRTLRLCMRDHQPAHEYSDEYGEDKDDTPLYKDSVETAAAYEQDFFAPTEDMFTGEGLAALHEQDTLDGMPPHFPENTSLESSAFDSSNLFQAQPQADAAFAQVEQVQPRQASRAPQEAPRATQRVQRQPQAHLQPSAAPVGHTLGRPAATASQPSQRPTGQVPRQAVASQGQGSHVMQQPVAQAPQQQAPQQQAQQQQQQAAPQTQQPARPLSYAQQQAVAYNTQMAQAQAAQHAATIAASQERMRMLQASQDEALVRRAQEAKARLAQQSAQQRFLIEQASAQQRASYTPVASTPNGTPPVGMYSHAAAQLTPQDAASAGRAGQAAARKAAQAADREAQVRSQAANAAAQSAGAAASRAAEAASRAEARLRVLAGLPPLEGDNALLTPAPNTVQAAAVSSQESNASQAFEPAVSPSAFSQHATQDALASPLSSSAENEASFSTMDAPLGSPFKSSPDATPSKTPSTPIDNKPASWLSDA